VSWERDRARRRVQHPTRQRSDLLPHNNDIYAVRNGTELLGPCCSLREKKGNSMHISKTLLAVSAAAMLTGGLAITLPASAHVVCNRTGDCWSTHANVTYPRDLGVRTYSDRYADQSYRERRWGNNGRTWRDENHDRDRGAYRAGVWFGF
jgi:hypothetical protein